MTKGQAKKLNARFKINYFVRNSDWEGFVHVKENYDGSLTLYETDLTQKNSPTILMGDIVRWTVEDKTEYTLTIDGTEYLDCSAADPHVVVQQFLTTYDAQVAVDNLVKFFENKYRQPPPLSY